jgi:CubicO group peptidase (beta-lactamase class C family)
MLYLLLLLMTLIGHTFSMHATIASSMEKLQRRTQESGADIVLVARQGKIIFQSAPPANMAAIDSQELAHACVALAYAFMLDEGKIPCLDVPVKFFWPDGPEWHTGYHASITLKHLLNQTSGLDRAQVISSDYRHQPIPAIYAPDAAFSENGNNWRLLATLVPKISGLTLADYLLEKLFIPLHINDVSWATSTEDPCLRLYLKPLEWMKIGQFLLNHACIGNKRHLSESTWQQIFSPSQKFSPFYGLGWTLEFYDTTGWWDDALLECYASRSVDAQLIRQLASLQGRTVHFSGQLSGSGLQGLQFSGYEPQIGSAGFASCLVAAVHNQGVPLCAFKTGKLKSFSAHGRGGQHLYVYPQGSIVALRQRAIDSESIPEDTFEDFTSLLQQIATEYDGWVD